MGFFSLCLQLFRVKPAVTSEPNAVAEIVGTRPPSRMSTKRSYAPSLASTNNVRRQPKGRVAKSSAPPSAYLDPRRPSGGPSRPSSRASSISSVVSENRADTVRRVRARYEHNPTEHMRLTHAMEEWKEADDTFNPRHRRLPSGDTAPSASGTSEDGHRRVHIVASERRDVCLRSPP
jgi:hypothetical protein